MFVTDLWFVLSFFCWKFYYDSWVVAIFILALSDVDENRDQKRFLFVFHPNPSGLGPVKIRYGQ